MVDSTIGALTAGDTPSGAEPIESEQAAASVRFTVNQVRGLGVEALASGAGTTDVSPASRLIFLTSGGTAGEELVNLLAPAPTLDGYYTAELLGVRVTIVLVAQTDPGDVVKVTTDGYDPSRADPIGGNTYSGVLLDYLAAAVTFWWDGMSWQLDADYAGNNYSSVSYNPNSINLSTGNVGDGSGSAPAISITAGNADGGVFNGGSLSLVAGGSGAGNNGGAGGVTITAGSATGADGSAGGIDLTAGDSANGNGGVINITGGDTAGPAGADTGGEVIIRGGDASGGGSGGRIILQAGNSADNNGLGVTINGGGSDGAAHNSGAITIRAGDNSHAAGIGADVVISAGKNGSNVYRYLVLENLPTVNPGGSDRVWNDGGTLKIT